MQARRTQHLSCGIGDRAGILTHAAGSNRVMDHLAAGADVCDQPDVGADGGAGKRLLPDMAAGRGGGCVVCPCDLEGQGEGWQGVDMRSVVRLDAGRRKRGGAGKTDLAPASGETCRTGMPMRRRSAAGPMPESRAALAKPA